MYWINHSIGSPKGQIKKHQFHPLDKFSQSTIDKLLASGTIREIIAPPFEVVATLKNHAIMLHERGCMTLMDVYRLGVAGLQEIVPELDAAKTMHQIEQLLRPDVPIPDGACDCD